MSELEQFVSLFERYVGMKAAAGRENQERLDRVITGARASREEALRSWEESQHEIARDRRLLADLRTVHLDRIETKKRLRSERAEALHGRAEFLRRVASKIG